MQNNSNADSFQRMLLVFWGLVILWFIFNHFQQLTEALAGFMAASIR